MEQATTDGRASKGASSTHSKFSRGAGVALKHIHNKPLKGKIQHELKLHSKAVKEAKLVYEWLKPTEAGYLEAEGLEKTRQFKQQDIVQEVGSGAQNLAFDLNLPTLGPYKVAMDRSGRHCVLGGSKGHLALFDWSRYHMLCELQVKESVRDACLLHNEQFFASAQKKHVYIYDRTGAEVHCCREHTDPMVMAFLPYHFLLASAGNTGTITYQDTSQGQIVAQHRPKLGPIHVMRANPWNAVMCVGHANGRVTMWTPNLGTAAVSMQCHQGAVNAVAVDMSGTYMATAGLDSKVHIWDLRNSYRQLHTYPRYPNTRSLDISQQGLLAIGFNSMVHIRKDALATHNKEVYIVHKIEGGGVTCTRFCAYQDILAVGHASGLSTMLVPGAGEPNFDSFVANPYQDAKQRHEGEVHQLLDKLQPDTIVLDPSQIGKVRKLPAEVQKDMSHTAKLANDKRRKDVYKRNMDKTRMKGKNTAMKRHRKKQDNVVKEKVKSTSDKLHKLQSVMKAKAAAEAAAKLEEVPRALHRFHRKG
eukprot:jgi/Ulvmu1/5191/UM021_0208.1